MSTVSDIVTKVDSAIDAIVSGRAASVTVDGETYTAQSLPALLKVRDHYSALVAQENVSANTPCGFGVTQLKAGDGK